MDKGEGLFEENNKHTAWDTVLVKPVFVHVGFLGKNK
jgi:hypothetical protein